MRKTVSVPGGPEHGERDRHAHVRPLEDEQQLAAVVAVGERAGREGEDQVGDRVEEADEPERRRRAAEQEHDVAERRPPRPSCRSSESSTPAEVAAESVVPKRGERRLSTAPPRLAPRGSLRERGRAEQRQDAAADRVGVEPSIPQPVRHTDARRLAQSGAGEHDRPVTRELVEPVRDLVRVECERASSNLNGVLVLVAPHVDEERAVLEELVRLRRRDPQRRAANGRRDVVSARRRGHQEPGPTASRARGRSARAASSPPGPARRRRSSPLHRGRCAPRAACSPGSTTCLRARARVTRRRL